MLFWVQIFIVEKIQTDMRSKLKNDTKCASMVTEQNQEVWTNSDAVLKSASKICNNISKRIAKQMYMYNKVCMIYLLFLLTKILNSK